MDLSAPTPTGLGLYKTVGRQRIRTVRQDDVVENSADIYGESTTVGVRADAFRYEASSDNVANSGDRLAAIISPKFSAVLGPWKKTEVFLNFGAGFHSTDARGVNTTSNSSTGETVMRVDPLVRTQILPKVTATSAAWWLDSDSELTYVGDAGTNEAGPAARRFGIETAIYWAPKDWLMFDSELPFTQACYRNSPGGKRPRRRLPIFAGCRAGVSLSGSIPCAKRDLQRDRKSVG